MIKETREKEILRIILENPGIASFDIRQHLSRNVGEHDRCVVAHRLTSLWRRGLVRRERVTERKAKTYRYWIMKERSPIKECSLEIVSRNPGVDAKEITNIIARSTRDGKASHSAVFGALKELVDTGVIYRKKIPKDYGHPSYRYWLSGEIPPDNVIDQQALDAGRLRWLTATQAADAAGVTVSQWWGLVGGNVLAPEIVAGEKRFTMDQVDMVRERQASRDHQPQSDEQRTFGQNDILEVVGESLVRHEKKPSELTRQALQEAVQAHQPE